MSALLARLAPAPTARRTRLLVLVVALVIALGVVPALVSDFSLQLTAMFLPFALLALSLDLLWGESKLISFGHGAFFALGGYAGGLILLGHGSSVGGGGGGNVLLDDGAGAAVSGTDRALDALHAVQIAGVPVLALLLPALLTGAVGLLVGLVVFRAAAPEVYLPLITLGIGVVAGIWFNDLELLGGSNGLSGIPSFAEALTGSGSATSTYLFNGTFVALAFGGYWAFRRSQVGWSWRALGDDPVRLAALGYPVARMRAYGFAASCAIAGLAGALYAATAGFMAPSIAAVSFSAQALIWVAVGGVGTVLGPLIGTLAVKWGEQWLSSDLGMESSWPLLLGLLLILVVVVAPRGLIGALDDAVRRALPRRPASAPAVRRPTGERLPAGVGPET